MIVDHKDPVRRRLRRAAISLLDDADLVRDLRTTPAGPETNIYSTLGNAKSVDR
jgi:hypothetical protein